MKSLQAACQKLRDFRSKIRGLSKWQKLLVAVLVVAVPAGIALSTLLLVFWKRSSK